MSFYPEMTLSTRRILLAALFVPALAALAAASAAWISWFEGSYASGYQPPILTAVWWSVWRPANAEDLLWAMGGITFLAACPVIGELFLRREFRRSPSPEVFFLRIFMLTLPLNVLRLIIPEISAEILPHSWGIMATRVAWFSRIFGLTALLNIGVFASDIPFRRSASILGMEALAAMAVAAMMPLDITQPIGNLLYRAGAETALALACVFMEILAIISLAGISATKSNSRYYVLSASLLAIVFGADLLFFASSPLVIPGAAALMTGFVAFVRQVRKIYQWL